MGLHVASRQSGDVTILDLRGKLTLNGDESALLGSHLQELLANGAHKLLLNLTNLTQIDSSGVSVIVSACVSLRDRGGRLKLLRPRGCVLEVFTVLHLLQMIPSFEEEAPALASFQSSASVSQLHLTARDPNRFER